MFGFISDVLEYFFVLISGLARFVVFSRLICGCFACFKREYATTVVFFCFLSGFLSHTQSVTIITSIPGIRKQDGHWVY